MHVCWAVSSPAVSFEAFKQSIRKDLDWGDETSVSVFLGVDRVRHVILLCLRLCLNPHTSSNGVFQTLTNDKLRVLISRDAQGFRINDPLNCSIGSFIPVSQTNSLTWIVLRNARKCNYTEPKRNKILSKKSCNSIGVES